MPGITLREALAAALESVPTVELSLGDSVARDALHGFIRGFIKEFAFNRGVIFEEHNLDDMLTEIAFELRRQPRPLAVKVPPLEAPCRICNAKPGVRCTNIHSTRFRDEPHGGRGEHDQRFR